MDVPEIAIPPRGRKVIPITDPTTGEVINARDVEQAEAAAVPLPETCCSSPHSDMETTGSNYTQVLDSLPPLSFGSQPSTPSNGVLLPAFAGQSLYQAPLPHFVGQHSPSAALPPLAGQQYYSIPSIPCFGQYSYGPPILQFPNQPVPIAPYPGIQPQVVHYTTQINMTPGSELAVFNDWNSPYAGGEYSPFQTMPSHPELQNRLICENNRLVQDAQNRDAQLRQLLTGPHPMHPHGSHVPAANQCGFSERWVARRRAPTQSPWTFKNEWERQQWQAHCERVRCEANTYLHAIGRDLDQERLARLELQRSFEDDDEHLELEVFAVPCDGNEGLVPNGATKSGRPIVASC
ncbi:hypothetical protein EJ06DRAFT_269209 [Trichodelitschia bisporula]|uniref:Uncharacterized protein n=1 Tax=Trichodelitschia bisporula TaxID=703511 RepID=A0A6G1HHW7_9PEZI|nr:hypothetical protein EJ06DRAFT_269209 [Trichodelitschia bisporula]